MAVRVETHAEPIPGYRLIERIGGGGFGEVWRASAPGGMHKAIKFVFGDLSGASDKGERAEQELKALKRVITVRHPYILSLERYDIIDGQLIIVMELAERNLWDRFKECRSQGLPGIPREELLRYMEEIAEALDLMNGQYQLQHLDIKPQNLFLMHQHVKVADFGLVKDLEGSQAAITGGITPVYAAPETFDGRVSRFSDQYSLGIVYQELLTGQRPFPGTNVRQLIFQHLQGTPNLTPLPPADQPTIGRALAKNPNDRFPMCLDLVRALRQGAPSSETAPGTDQPTVPVPVPNLPIPGGSWQGFATPPPSGGLTANIRAPIESSAGGDLAELVGPSTHLIRMPTGASSSQVATRPGSRHSDLAGTGTLFPALIVGLGQMGLNVVQRLRETLATETAPLDRLPNLRFLSLDTDPEVVRLASHTKPGVGLTANEVLLASLNRPSHYLKPRDGRPALETWLNPRLLYRIPRSQVTTGVRALGRLAYADNYRVIVRRLQGELDALADDKALQAAAQQTGLGYRSNRPRVYLVVSLGGGSGSGMFIDAAYTVRALLRQRGYDPPDVVGLLLVPPVDGNRTRLMTVGNTFAALTELHYYGSPGTRYSARFHEREKPLQDDGPPFNRCLVVPLPDESDEVAGKEVVDLCARVLAYDLTAPLGKAADLGRAGLPAPEWDKRGQYFQSAGLFRLSWPRRALCDLLSRKLCRDVVQRWLSKDSKPLRQGVQDWIERQWADRDLDAESFIHRLQAAVVRAQGKPVDTLFADAIAPLTSASAQGEPPGPRGRGKGPDPRILDPTHLTPVLAALDELLGVPGAETPAEVPTLVRVLRESAERLGTEWGQKLAELSVQLIEEPAYRLAGAEEATRQVVALVERALQIHEPLANDLAEQAAEAYRRLRALANPDKTQRRPSATPAEVLDWLKGYPRWRFQSLVLQRLSAAFVSLRGHLTDELREINFCRVRLAELQGLFVETPAEPGAKPKREGVLGRQLLTAGCKDVGEAANLFLAEVTPEVLLDLDERIEAMLRKQFTALVHICISPGGAVLKKVEGAMRAVAFEFVAERLPAASTAGLFFEQFPDDEQAEEELAGYFEEAAPEIHASRSPRPGPGVAELCLVAAPNDPEGQRLRDLVRQGQPRHEVQEAVSLDDVVIYRERLNLALEDLEQLGPVGRDAYVQMTSTDNFTPHSRMDVDFRSR